MDLSSIEEFHCGICFELFGDGAKCPRLLTCGHCFCSLCLQKLLVQSPLCPTCKKDIQFTKVDSIPVNYPIKSLVSRIDSRPVETSGIDPTYSFDILETTEAADCINLKKDDKNRGLKSEGYCDQHCSFNHLRCVDCEIWICGVCAVLDHKQHSVLLVDAALNEMKEKYSCTVQNNFETHNAQNSYVDKLLEILEKDKSSVKKKIKKLQQELRSEIGKLKSVGKGIEKLKFWKSDRKKFSAELKNHKVSAEKADSNDEFTTARIRIEDHLELAKQRFEMLAITQKQCHSYLTIDILQNWSKEHSIYAERHHQGKTHYGKVAVGGGRVWVHCFHPQRPARHHVVISFRQLLFTFGGTFELPQRAFLQVHNKTTFVGNIIVAMDSLSPRALNFLLLCLGFKDTCYAGMSIRRIVFDIPGDGIGNKELGTAFVKGIKDGGIYEAPVTKRYVGGFSTKNNMFSSFYIRLEDYPSKKCLGKFGFVEEGFEICQTVMNYHKMNHIIKSCGLVI